MSEAPKQKLWFYQWCVAMFGATVIGVSLPAILVSMNWGSKPLRITVIEDRPRKPVSKEQSIELRVRQTIVLVFSATILCGPLALILGSIVLNRTRKDAQCGRELGEVVRTGMWMGALLSFFNFPAWGVASIMPATGDEKIVKVFLLFAVAGSSAGAWIGWQAWRVEFPGTPWMPPFSLMSLIVIVVAWGGLLAVFMPR